MNSRLFFIILILFSVRISAQEFHFSQFNSNPLSLNPANAGNTGGARFNTGARIQWPKIVPYSTFFTSYDMYLEKLRGGVGVNVVHDNVANGRVISDYFSFYYSPQFNFSNKKLIIKPGFEAGFFTRKVDYSGLVFSGPIEPHLLGSERTNLLNVSTGLIVSTKRLYTGFSFLHLTSYNSSINSGRFNLYGAYTFGSADEEGFSIAPSFLFSQQYISAMLVAGLNIKYNQFLLGVFTRESDALIVAVGYKSKKMKISYSYDYTISRLTNKVTGGAHELMFSLYFNKNVRNSNPINHFLLF